MSTYTYIIIYLSICVVVTTLLPVARSHWKKFLRLLPQYYEDVDWEIARDEVLYDYNKNIKFEEWRKKIIYTLVFGIRIVLLFLLMPLLLPIIIRANKIKAQKDSKARIESLKEWDIGLQEEIDTNLYYSRMGGAGTISCCDCSYTENIVSFLHGSSMHYYTNSGLQCQSCGKFHAIRYWKSSDEVLCECGGILEREKPIFCPKCKSKDMKYDMKYMT